MNLETILTIVSALLGGGLLVFGGKLEIVKRKFNQAKSLFKEAYDVIGKVNVILNKISEILADGKITPDELTEFRTLLVEFKNELIDVKVAFLKLIGKS